MTTPLSRADDAAETLDTEPTLDPGELRAHDTQLARGILAHAAAMGVAADLLLRRGFTGLGFPLWLSVLALSVVALVWRAGRHVPREAGAWLATAILFGAGMAWRDAGELQFLDFVATLFALGMAAIAIGDARFALHAARIRDTVWAGVAVIRAIAAGIVPIALREKELHDARQELHGTFRPALRALLIALPLLVVFGSLLRSADPVFASIVAFPELDFETIVSHIVVVSFFAWIVAGWARGALVADLARHRAPERMPFALGMLDVTTALGVLNALFALYVATQLGWFFGGEQFLQERTGLTAAEYARQGFFQMVWVVLLVVPVLLGTRAALRPGRELERRHTALALPLLWLLGVMILSAVLRLRLYVHYFGLTTDRLYPLVFMGWLAVVLLWLSLTVLRGAGRSFVTGAVVTGLATLAALNIAVPDLIVARVNIARAQRGTAGSTPQLDLAHLTQLSGEAMPLTIAAVLAPSTGAPGSAERAASDRARCSASSRLLLRRRGLTPETPSEEWVAAWRGWNLGKAEAERALREHAAELAAVLHAACPRRTAAPTEPALRPAIAPAGT